MCLDCLLQARQGRQIHDCEAIGIRSRAQAKTTIQNKNHRSLQGTVFFGEHISEVRYTLVILYSQTYCMGIVLKAIYSVWHSEFVGLYYVHGKNTEAGRDMEGLVVEDVH